MPRRDLTTGPIPAHLLGLAIPMVVSSLLHSLQSMVDMYFVGWLGPEAIAAVGMSGSVMMILVTIFVGLNIATGALVSRNVGAKRLEQADRVAGQALTLTLAFALGIGLAGRYMAGDVLRALNAAPDVVGLGVGYLRIVMGGVFFMAAVFIISGILQGAGDAVTPMWLGVLTTVVNCALNPVLIHGYLGFPALGVRGSAWATLVARAAATGVGFVMLMRGRLPIRLHLRDFRPRPRIMWRIIAIGFPSSLRMSVRMVMNLALMAVVGTFGTQAMAAYVIGIRVRMVGLMPVFGFAGASAAMVGQNLGAKQPDRARSSAWTATAMAVTLAVVAAAVFALFAPWIVRIFNGAPEVVAAGAVFLRVTAIGLVTAAVGIVLSRSMSGAGDTLSPLVITVIVLWGFQIPAAVYMSGVKELWGGPVPGRSLFAWMSTGDLMGVWYAMVVASVLFSIVMAAWFRLGRWQRKKVD